MSENPPIVIGLNAVILAVTDEEPRILTVPRGDHSPALPPADRTALEPIELVDALPFGPLDPARDRTLELALRGWIREQTGIEVGYVEQLYTFADKNRDPRERQGGPRVVSIGYLTLGREGRPAAGSQARWLPWYDYLPWEDWREGRPPILDQRAAPALCEWADGAGEPRLRRLRRERVDIAFGLGGAPWDPYRVLDRYELLYEAGLVREARRDRTNGNGIDDNHDLGRSMCFDHRRILATALSRLRGKIKYRPVVFELLPATFTLLQLQRVVEALAGQRLHKQNFRRLVMRGGLVEETGELSAVTGGRPAKLFHFRRDVLRERPTPGVGLPALPSG
jgi:hypothetical protein